MGEQHLNPLSFAARLFECFGLGQGAGNVARLFVDAARGRAERRLWAALHLERAASTVGCTGEITKRLAIDHRAGRRQKLACRADIDVALFVEGEVFRLKVPSSRFDLSMTGMCGLMSLSLTSQLRFVPEP